MKKWIKSVVLLIISCFTIFCMFTSCDDLGKALRRRSDAPIKTIVYEKDGETFATKAVEGQVIVVFDNSVSRLQAFNRIIFCGGRIIYKVPYIRYYLVGVESGHEYDFIRRIQKKSDINYAGLNTVEEICAAKLIVLDNFYGRDGSEHGAGNHGDMVAYTLKKNSGNADVSLFNVGSNDGQYMSNDKIDKDLIANLEDNKDNSIVINMSFGVGFNDDGVKYWTDTDTIANAKKRKQIRESYKKSYKSSLKRLISVVSKYDDRDFVIVKSAGNKGLKELDAEILDDFYQNLTSEQQAVFDKHFIIASAKDSRWDKYSNETSGYTSMCTKVDISDVSYNNEPIYGTSFAAPRLAGYISTVANSNDLKVTEVNEIVKKVTQENTNGDYTVSYSDMEKEAKAFTEYKKVRENNRRAEEKAEETKGHTDSPVLDRYEKAEKTQEKRYEDSHTSRNTTFYVKDLHSEITSIQNAASRNITFYVKGIPIEMVYVQGGTFTMGATAEQGSDAYDDERPPHRVTLSDYFIGQYEVTQELWQAVMGSNPSRFTGNLQRPVEQVSWNDIQEFLRELNRLTGRTFTLPTEAQWEFAARGGTKSRGYKYSGSNMLGNVAWYGDNSNETTHPVGQKQANELGLYDMAGNVWEWCNDRNDRYEDYSRSSQTNPQGSSSGSYRVLRGGSWNNNASYSRVSGRRNGSYPVYRYDRSGFRLALSSLSPSNSNAANYHFEPSVSVIEGTIGVETFYDANDKEEVCGVLYLDKPVNILARQDDELSEDVYSISKIQLSYTGNSPIRFSPYQGKRVRLTGTFMFAHTAHHHTPALMFVDKLEVCKP